MRHRMCGLLVNRLILQSICRIWRVVGLRLRHRKNQRRLQCATICTHLRQWWRYRDPLGCYWHARTRNSDAAGVGTRLSFFRYESCYRFVDLDVKASLGCRLTSSLPRSAFGNRGPDSAPPRVLPGIRFSFQRHTMQSARTLFPAFRK